MFYKPGHSIHSHGIILKFLSNLLIKVIQVKDCYLISNPIELMSASVHCLLWNKMSADGLLVWLVEVGRWLSVSHVEQCSCRVLNNTFLIASYICWPSGATSNTVCSLLLSLMRSSVSEDRYFWFPGFSSALILRHVQLFPVTGRSMFLKM